MGICVVVGLAVVCVCLWEVPEQLDSFIYDDNVKGVARSDEPTEDYQLNLPYGAVWLVSAHCLLFWFTLTALIPSFWAAAGSCFPRKKTLKTHCT